MVYSHLVRLVMLLLAVMVLPAVAQEKGKVTDSLTISSSAPPLDVEHWVQTGDFKPVTEFQPGNVYVVEFWATWCGPCIASMPHISEVQREYADKQVQVISISNEKLATVEKFLKRKVRGETDRTYAELTSNYCLTTDPDRSSHEAYMTAAGQTGIPCAFIVDQERKIAWIGHPMSMDEPLDQIVAGNWDREQYAVVFAEKQFLKQVARKVTTLQRSNEYDEALELINESLQGVTSEAARNDFRLLKLQVALAANKTDGLTELVGTLLENSDSPTAVNRVAWKIYETHAGGQTIDEQVLKRCLDASIVAAQQAEGQSKGYILDTVAHLQHSLGMLDEALATQKRALPHVTGRMRQQLEDFLNKLKKEKSREGKENSASNE